MAMEVENSPVSLSGDVACIKEAKAAEEAVGICEYVNTDAQGFTAIFKQRFVDFLVNEVDPQGRVLHLTDMKLPPRPSKSEASDDPIAAMMSADEAIAVLTDLCGSECAEQVRKASVDPEFRKTFSYETEPMEDKQQRTQLHQCVKAFGGVLDSKTVGGNRIQIVPLAGKPKKNKIQPPGKFVQFLLYKENNNTQEALNRLARFLKINVRKFESAGTKDRRAVTVQRISVPYIGVERLVAFNTLQRSRHIRLGHFEYTDAFVFLGDLSGNRFTITLRHVQGMQPSEIEQRLQTLSTHGFINYYGMQRFGNSANAATHRVGELILRKQWKEAIELILDPRDDGENEVAHAARMAWKQGQLKEALDAMPRSHTSESFILKYFVEKESGHVRNYANALAAVPRNSRILYTHAYQSFIWNRAASERVRLYGRQVVIGDLVRSKGEEAVRVLTKEAETLLFQPWDVVLPLPGSDIVYPQHEIGTFYRETLEQQGLLEALQNGTSGDPALKGGYRPLFGQVKDMQWEFLRYDDPKVPLVLTDLDRMEDAERKIESVEDGRYQALVLSFTLGSSQYATMALRELMKMPLQSQFQKMTNVE